MIHCENTGMGQKQETLKQEIIGTGQQGSNLTLEMHDKTSQHDY